MKFLNNLKLRWKLVAMVLPLVVVPILLVGGVVGTISTRQAYRGVTQTSKADLEHMARFSLDLLNAHYQQFQVYKQDKERTIRQDLATLVNFAWNLADAQQRQAAAGRLDVLAARGEARKALKEVSIGASGYLYAMTTDGVLTVHPASEGQRIYDSRDDDGRYFIREMCRQAREAPAGEVLFIVYPWRNEILGDKAPRRKVVAYRYFRPWDWIVAAGSYLDETYEDAAFERRSLEELKARIKEKKVGQTGYIYAMTNAGELTIHPTREGDNIYGSQDEAGRPFIKEMCEKKTGWIRYPWRNPDEPAPRTKIVRYEYFEPWDWIVAVGSYEDEFYHEANKIRGSILVSMLGLTLAVGVVAAGLVLVFSEVFTEPIRLMDAVIQRVRRGRLDEQVPVSSRDELGELAEAFNEMTSVLKRNRELEATLAQQGKMASLGVLSSGVAHEINNPLGVILGYAGYLERKIDPADPNVQYIQEIKRESKRCKKIVQDLLSYARVPRPSRQTTDLNGLLDQIVEFAANHADLQGVTLVKDFDPALPPVPVDGDQIRQVAINLILNAGAAMPDGGQVTVRTGLTPEGTAVVAFADTGAGIPAEDLERIFEPFFTTKAKGTGLGLAITRQIVELHHGSIRVESEVGVGTRVTVSLPVEVEDSCIDAELRVT